MDRNVLGGGTILSYSNLLQGLGESLELCVSISIDWGVNRCVLRGLWVVEELSSNTAKVWGELAAGGSRSSDGGLGLFV